MLPHINVFGLTIPMFGVCMSVGMLAAFTLLYFIRKYVSLTDDDILTATIYGIITGMIGSKLLYWIVEFDQILADPHYLLESLTQGFVFYGALIAGIGGVYWFAHRKKKPFLTIIDLLAPCFALAQGFGRIGCFLAGCCYGSPSDCAIAVTYPPGASAPAGVPLLPTQLMESAFLFVLTVFLVWLLKQRKTAGVVSGWYLTLYGVWRFIIEFFRSDDRGAVGSLSTSQFIGIFIVIAGIAVLLLIKKGVIVSRETIAPKAKEAPDGQQKENSEK